MLKRAEVQIYYLLSGWVVITKKQRDEATC